MLRSLDWLTPTIAALFPNRMFRWFVGVGIDDAVWDHSTFSKNRDRLLEGDIAAKLLGAVLAQPRVKRLLSTDHFSVDGTLIEAWASVKSFRPKDGSGEPPAPGGETARRTSTVRSAATRRTPRRPVRRRPRSFCGRCCCRRSIRSARSGLMERLEFDLLQPLRAIRAVVNDAGGGAVVRVLGALRPYGPTVDPAKAQGEGITPRVRWPATFSTAC